jgi:putative ABC transport system permease protein
MSWLSETWRRIRSVVRRDAIEQGLDDEIRFHIDQQTEKNRRAGMPPDEARRQAVLRFGGLERAKEETRDEVRPALLEDAARDVRYASRLLARSPGFTLAALVTLAVGIGATSAIYGVVRAVMLEPLPYHQPDRLVTIWETNRGGTSRNVIAPANFVEWRERTRTIEHLGMTGGIGTAFILDGRALDVPGRALSAASFRALGVEPMIGRAYTEQEDFGGRPDVIVISYEFWQGRLGGRSDAVGLTLATVDGPKTVLGVMPPAFTILGERAEFYVPYSETVEELRALRGRGNSYAIGRLRDGVSFDQAYAEMRTIYAALAQEVPQRNANRTVMMFGLQEQMTGELEPAILTLVAAAALVLLVACVNVANLLLARSAVRERELGMRTALGARRGRLVRQMLAESLLLAVAGGVAGLGVAALCHRGLLVLVGEQIPIPRLEQITLDTQVVTITLLVAVVTGVLFGLVPALVSTRQAAEGLREGGRHGTSRRLHRLLGAMVVAEVALSLVLLTGAGLMMRSLVKLRGTDLGFRVDNVLTASVQLPGTGYGEGEAEALFRDLRARLGALPGVEHVGGASCYPVPFSCIGTSYWRADQPKPADGQLQSGHIRPVTPGFLGALGISTLEGRDFADGDTAQSQPVAIISVSVAREQFGDAPALGRPLRVSFGHVSGRDDVEWTVVGVVADVRSSLDGPLRRTIYVPRAQRPSTRMIFFLQTTQDATALGGTVTRALQAAEPQAPIEIRTLDDVVGGTIARQRAIAVLLSVFALVALALAAVGVYGVMAFSVRERAREIGVRMALGASSSSVFRLVLGRALRLVALGLAVGLFAASLLTQLLERLLFEIEPLDPWTFVATAALLLVVAIVASCLPARRSTRIAPIEALRVN